MDHRVTVLCYGADLLITGYHEEEIKKVKNYPTMKFPPHDFRKARDFLGIKSFQGHDFKALAQRKQNSKDRAGAGCF